MKKIIKQNNNLLLLLCLGILFLGSCKKKESQNEDPVLAAEKTGNYSLQLSGRLLEGNIFGEGIFTQSHEITGQPTLELHLAGSNGQIDIILLNPSINTDIKCGVGNNENLCKVADYANGIAKSYASGIAGDVTIRLSKLDTKTAIGTITGMVKNIDYPSTTDATITNGNFTINF